MTLEQRGVQHLKTMTHLEDGRRTRTPAGALLEMSMLEMEKQRLGLEMRRAQRRCAEIQARLLEIGKKARLLQTFVARPDLGTELPPLERVASPLPIHSPPTDTLKRRRLAY